MLVLQWCQWKDVKELWIRAPILWELDFASKLLAVQNGLLLPCAEGTKAFLHASEVSCNPASTRVALESICSACSKHRQDSWQTRLSFKRSWVWLQSLPSSTWEMWPWVQKSKGPTVYSWVSMSGMWIGFSSAPHCYVPMFAVCQRLWMVVVHVMSFHHSLTRIPTVLSRLIAPD